MRAFLLAVTAFIMLVSPSAARAQEAAGTGDLTPTGRGAYVSIAGAMDLFTMRSGRLAIEKARNTELRELAQTLSDEHARRTEQLLGAARALGMDAHEPAMMPMHWEMLRQLERASGSRFDRTFLRQQLRVHEMALALHQNYAANGDRESLREVARAAIPMLENHMARVRSLSR
jgi:putative membrane protein